MFAPAKINLFLHVGARRPDGYHDLLSLVAFASAGDELAASPGEELSLAIEGPFAEALKADESNLVMRAARALQADLREKGMAPPGARLALTKNLPLASGIGGGSSDAAATLKSLNAMWKGGLSDTELTRIGLALGADVPVCLSARTSMMAGIGERVSPGPRLPPTPVVLVNPRVEVPTGPVFKALQYRTGVDAVAMPPSFDTAAALAAFLASTRNDLEAPAIGLAPEIGACRDAMRASAGCALARMSGSGATCFGIFETGDQAAAAAKRIAAAHPDWWTVAAEFMR